MIVRPQLGYAENFELLICLFDVEFSMVAIVERIISLARPKIKAMFRICGRHDFADISMRCKAHVRTIIECVNDFLLHVSATGVAKFDELQRS